MASPSSSHPVCVNTQANLTSRLWAGWPSVLPLHCSVSSIQLHIQNRNRLTHHHGQVQAERICRFRAAAGGDAGSSGLRVRSTDWAATSNPARSFLCTRPRSKGRIHAAYSEGAVAVSVAVYGKLAIVAARARIPGARQFQFTHYRENAPRAQLAEVRLTAAWAKTRPSRVATSRAASAWIAAAVLFSGVSGSR